MSEVANRRWDVIVVGTGMGGATLGHAIARRGYQVLFCERGRSYLDAPDSKRGNFAETFLEPGAVPATQHRGVLERAGRWPDPVKDCSSTRPSEHIPFIGSGTGGSTALYGGAMERFFPQDFAPAPESADPADGRPVDGWPIAYQDLAPYYTAAERLYRVRGGRDPLRTQEALEPLLDAPPMGPANRSLHQALTAHGVHPYRLPTAYEYQPGCQGCQGYLCAGECKNDSARICLRPAVQDHAAHLLTGCTVDRLETQDQRVSAVHCRWQGKPLKLQGRVVVLAAGALATPLILLRSENGKAGRGLGNATDMVGRNLMRHCIDLYAVKAPTQPGETEHVKELAFNDFYWDGTENLGTVQSFGRLPPAPILLAEMANDLRRFVHPAVAGLFRAAAPAVRPLLGRLLRSRLLLVSTLEDFPDPSNRVYPGAAGETQIAYLATPATRHRITRFRVLMKELLRPLPTLLMSQAENNERIAHVCGTCRMGRDPTTSVVDADNRVHAADNLYVADSSFFPSSGGTNPSLTIAANALRMADRLCDSL